MDSHVQHNSAGEAATHILVEHQDASILLFLQRNEGVVEIIS